MKYKWFSSIGNNTALELKRFVFTSFSFVADIKMLQCSQTPEIAVWKIVRFMAVDKKSENVKLLSSKAFTSFEKRFRASTP
jgi:hypothetical protein